MELNELLILKSNYTMESSSLSSDLASTSSADQPQRGFCGLRTHPPLGRASTPVDTLPLASRGFVSERSRDAARSTGLGTPSLPTYGLQHCSDSPEHRLPTDASHCDLSSSHGCGEAHDVSGELRAGPTAGRLSLKRKWAPP